MPHLKYDPIESIISRQIESQEVIEAINLYCEGLDAFVDFSTHILQWSFNKETTTYREDSVNLVFCSMYRRIVEIADSISVCLKSSIVEPCEVFLRSLLEVTFSFEYLLEGDSENRALAYQFFHIAEMLTFLKRHDKRDTNFKKYLTDYQLYGFQYKEPPQFQSLASRIEMGNKLIDKPEYAAIKAEHLRLKKLPKKHSWFTFFSGHTNLGLLYTVQDLSKYVKKYDLYELLYKTWSTTVHGSDTISGNFFGHTDGSLSMLAIRQPHKIYELANLTFRLLEIAVLLVPSYLNNKEQNGDILYWYKSFQINYSKPVINKQINFEMPGINL